MLSHSLPSILANAALFSALDAEESAMLAQQTDLKRLFKGQTLFNTGDTGGAMYLVVTGAIEL